MDSRQEAELNFVVARLHLIQAIVALGNAHDTARDGFNASNPGAVTQGEGWAASIALGQSVARLDVDVCTAEETYAATLSESSEFGSWGLTSTQQ